MASLSLQSVSKTYPDGSVGVSGVSVDVRDGEALVLLGPSGCGKSTTLRLIAGLEDATSGRIVLGDRDITHVKPKDRDLAMVFQSYALYPHLSVEENIGFALRMRGVRRADRRDRVLKAADQLGLSDVLAKRPSQLSGGQRQRVALGRAIVREPSAFLFDEPLSNLDPQRRVSTRHEIRRLQRELGVTTLYVTHDHEEAMALGDRIVIMNEGKVAQVGTPEEVYHKPVSSFVGSFLGSPRMNLLDAEVGGEDGRTVVIDGGPKIQVDAGRVPEALGGGSRVILGIRPEDLDVHPDGQIEGEVIDVESVGFALDVLVRCGPHEIRARIAPDPGARIGERVRLGFSPSSAHVFVS